MGHLDSKLKLIHAKNKETISFVNAGGCGISAYILGYYLIKLGYKPSFLITGSNQEAVSSFCKLNMNVPHALKKKNRSFGIGHIHVKVGKKVFDSVGMYKYYKDNLFSLFGSTGKKRLCIEGKWTASYVDAEINIDELRVLIAKSGWNDMYDKTQNKQLHKNIITHLKKKPSWLNN